jgi:hypothetical protein
LGKLVGPLMLALLIGIAIFMLIAMQSPELAAQFRRPEGFYNNMLGKTAVAILFAAVVSLVVWIVRGRIK